MALRSQSLPNLIGGVSQQPASLRFASQSADEVNTYASPADGLRWRPPTQHVGQLMAAPASSVFEHTVNRDTLERYQVVIADGQVRVWELATGVQRAVNTPDGTGYLAAADPATAFRAITVADFTFIVNTAVTTALDPANVAPARPFEALVNVRAGAYGRTYRLVVNGTPAQFVTPNGATAADAPAIDTTNIATQLVSALTAAGITAGNGWTVTRYASAIYISRATDFSLTAEDGAGGENMRVAKGRVQRFTDLPRTGEAGFVVEVSGDTASAFDNYWVRLDKANANDAEGTWRECPKPGTVRAFNAATMPHVLVREANGTFTFRRAPWSLRECGDDELAPAPSFVGRKLNDLFFHKNRLGFLSDENAVLSRAGDYFNLWRQTLTSLLDDDPIDVGTSAARVSILRHAEPFDESLLLFSEQTQFRLADDGLLTPKTVSLAQVTAVDCSPRAKPVAAGRGVFFISPNGAWDNLHEMLVGNATERVEAFPVTEHVPRYIPAGSVKLAASPTENVVVLRTAATPSRLYVYRYLWAGDRRVLSSWRYWEFGTGVEVLGANFINSRLWLVLKRAGFLWLEFVDLDAGVPDATLDFIAHLDRRIGHTATTRTYDALADATTISLPYDVPLDAKVGVVARLGGSVAAGSPALILDRPTTTQVRVRGNWTSQPFYFGLAYERRYTFSPFYPRQEGEGGSTALVDGRMQVTHLRVVFAETGSFRALVALPGRPERAVPFNGGLPGLINPVDGSFTVPVFGRGDTAKVTIVSDDVAPVAFSRAEVEGHYYSRVGGR